MWIRSNQRRLVDLLFVCLSNFVPLSPNICMQHLIHKFCNFACQLKDFFLYNKLVEVSCKLASYFLLVYWKMWIFKPFFLFLSTLWETKNFFWRKIFFFFFLIIQSALMSTLPLIYDCMGDLGVMTHWTSEVTNRFDYEKYRLICKGNLLLKLAFLKTNSFELSLSLYAFNIIQYHFTSRPWAYEYDKYGFPSTRN